MTRRIIKIELDPSKPILAQIIEALDTEVLSDIHTKAIHEIKDMLNLDPLDVELMRSVLEAE